MYKKYLGTNYYIQLYEHFIVSENIFILKDILIY